VSITDREIVNISSLIITPPYLLGALIATVASLKLLTILHRAGTSKVTSEPISYMFVYLNTQ